MNAVNRSIVATLTFTVLVLWVFPKFWYTRTEPSERRFWLRERDEIGGWDYSPLDVSRSAERTLVADRLVNGEFRHLESGAVVRVFSAWRDGGDANEIGIFVHTPDRCWTEAGWTIQRTVPDVARVTIGGMEWAFERRIFEANGARELVYFGGLAGGRPLPYRLDHNLSVAMRSQTRASESDASHGARLRATDRRLWTRVWEAFTSRRPLFGAKQFIRVSSPAPAGREVEADRLIHEILNKWLKPEALNPLRERLE